MRYAEGLKLQSLLRGVQITSPRSLSWVKVMPWVEGSGLDLSSLSSQLCPTVLLSYFLFAHFRNLALVAG